MAIPRPPRPRDTFRRNAVFRGLSGGVFALLSPSLVIRRNALQKGVLGGNKVWLAVFLAISSRNFLKKRIGRHAELVATEVLTKGQFVSVQSIPPVTRRQRRALRSR